MSDFYKIKESSLDNLADEIASCMQHIHNKEQLDDLYQVIDEKLTDIGLGGLPPALKNHLRHFQLDLKFHRYNFVPQISFVVLNNEVDDLVNHWRDYFEEDSQTQEDESWQKILAAIMLILFIGWAFVFFFKK
jgi:hypothetical protein